MVRGTDRLRNRVKSALDRRYASILELNATKRELQQTSQKVATLQREVEEHSNTIIALTELESIVELRDRIMEAHRLASEGAEALERLLQQDLLLRRDLEGIRTQVNGDHTTPSGIDESAGT